jgi:cold-inducible RNA-binding protein
MAMRQACILNKPNSVRLRVMLFLCCFLSRPSKSPKEENMATKLFVRSLSYNTTEASLEELFAAIGKVISAKIIMDRDTNRSKGFGFVEMSTDEEAQEAIKQLDGKELDGRAIAVTEARPREDNRSGGGRSFGGGNGGYGDNRGGNRY